MNKRFRKYVKQRRSQKRQNGFEFISFSIPSYDSERVVPDNDEPNCFKNFGLMMPKKAIKMPTKKEMKKWWYSKKGQKQRNVFPVLHGMRKPWELKVGGYSCPPPPPDEFELFGYTQKIKPLNMQYFSERLRRQFEGKAWFLDNEGNATEVICK